MLPVLFVLASAELVFQVREASLALPVEVVSWREYEADGVLGWVPVPGGTHVVRGSGSEVTERSNSLRLLGPETTLSRRPGEFRVLLIGDSITEGLDVLRDQRFARLMEDALGERLGRRTEVLNAGRSGYQTDQEVLFYESEGRRFGADVAVLVVYVGNDVIGNTESTNDTGTGPVPKPRFRVADGALTVTVPGADALADRSASRPMFDVAKDWVAERSALYRAARAGWANFLRWAGAREVPSYWRVFRRSATGQTEEAWALTETLLARLRDGVAADGAALIVAIVPDEIQVSSEKWRSFVDFHRLDPGEWDPVEPSRRFAQICAARGLDCIDLLGTLRGVDQPYLPRGGHLSPAGHRVVAEALTDRVARRLSIRAGE